MAPSKRSSVPPPLLSPIAPADERGRAAPGLAKAALPFPPRVAVAPTKFARGFDGTTSRRAPAVYRVMELHDALERRYATDAHLVTYVVEGATRQPRINKVGLPSFSRAMHVEAFFCDIDNPGHAAWDANLRRRALDRFDSLEVLQAAGLYFTPHGQRVVQPIDPPLPVSAAEVCLRRWLAWLEGAGLEVDWACRDWTRHFRLPHVVRDGRRSGSPLVRLERMRPLALSVFAPPEARYPMSSEVPAALLVAEPPVRSSVPWSTALDPGWRPHVERIAAAVRKVSTEWHSLFLALAGALLSCGAEPEELPLLCRAISAATCVDERPADREQAGRSTAERFLAGLPVMGLRALRERWPVVAQAFVPPPPMGFRELTRALDLLGGSREMAALLGWRREEIVQLLQRGQVPGRQAAAIRAAVEARRPEATQTPQPPPASMSGSFPKK